MKPWTPPATSLGQPDLEGVWVNNSATPLERPEALKDRAFLTDEDVIELKARAARLVHDGSNDFPTGDNLFLAVRANREHDRSPNATGGADDTVEKCSRRGRR